MTDPHTPDLTARVDALIYHMGECRTIDNHDRQTVIDMRDTIRALSAERDREKAYADQSAINIDNALERAETAEAEIDKYQKAYELWKAEGRKAISERDALKAENARLREAVLDVAASLNAAISLLERCFCKC
jgi:membrane-bound ClpP family serine protease